MTEKISLDEKFRLFRDRWRPKVIAAVNSQEVKIVKVKGEFPWHQHDDEDEFFLVWRGRFRVEFRDRVVDMGPGECVVVPEASSTEHAPTRRPRFLMLRAEWGLNTGQRR